MAAWLLVDFSLTIVDCLLTANDFWQTSYTFHFLLSVITHDKLTTPAVNKMGRRTRLLSTPTTTGCQQDGRATSVQGMLSFFILFTYWPPMKPESPTTPYLTTTWQLQLQPSTRTTTLQLSTRWASAKCTRYAQFFYLLTTHESRTTNHTLRNHSPLLLQEAETPDMSIHAHFCGFGSFEYLKIVTYSIFIILY